MQVALRLLLLTIVIITFEHSICTNPICPIFISVFFPPLSDQSRLVLVNVKNSEPPPPPSSPNQTIGVQ